MKKEQIRWVILFLVFCATGLNFLDRQILSMTIIRIQETFRITDVQYGWINTSFLLSYALMFTIGGRIIDLTGGRLGLGLAVSIWSVACLLHGVMENFYQLLAFRFLLGFGEGACFPGAARVAYEWFDSSKRALANGIAIGGSAIGAVIAPPLTSYVANELGWRASFIIPGAIGIIWVMTWFLISWKRFVEVPAKQAKTHSPSFLAILANRYVMAFIAIRFLLDPVMYFLMFWVPKYLSEQRNISFEKIGELFWIPFLALGVSNIFGGLLSDKLIQEGFSVNKARKTIMGIAAAMTLCVPFIVLTESHTTAIALLAVMLFAHGLWITNYITSIADMFGGMATSTVVGLSGTAGAISALVLNPLIGIVIGSYSYTPLWVVSGLLYPLGYIILLVFIPAIRSVSIVEKERKKLL